MVSLHSPSATDISVFGAKAANLAKALQLGFAVPEGLAVSRMCGEKEFSALAQEVIGKLTPPLAVRSSAVKEDSESKAFAGVFETCLGMRNAETLIEAFTKVKSSGTTNIVKSYHGENISHNTIGVLLQSMVNATRAGVAFSRDPITGEDKVIIEGNYGLGKSVVDGDVTPDSIEVLIDGTSNILIGRKAMQVVLTDTGIQNEITSVEKSQSCSLSENEIKEIAELARKVDSELGFAADIEWALDEENVLWLLQARPITTITK
jgi:pyruvate,water dikinase